MPLPSSAVYVITVCPRAYGSVESSLTTTEPQLSLVVVAPKLTPLAVHTPASVLTVRSDGQVILGASLSSTVTVCVHVLVLPLPSSAVYVITVWPSAYGSVESSLTTTDPQLSLLVVEPKLTPLAVHAPTSVLTVKSDGHVILGAS